MGDDILERSDELDRRIAGTDSLIYLTHRAQQNRLFIVILSVSFTLDVILTVLLGLVAYRAQQASMEADSLTHQTRVSCLAANETRQGQRVLWHHLLDIPPTTPRTPAQQQQADDFGRYVDQLFAPRQC